MQIEYPEDPVPRPPLTAAADTYPTIGQFYGAVLKAFQQNDVKFIYQIALQLTNRNPDIFVVDGLSPRRLTPHLSANKSRGQATALRAAVRKLNL
jgi:hypothetical protein